MSEEYMNHDECVKQEISRYMELQRIKRANGDTVNHALTDAITECTVTLQTLGVNVDGLVLSS